MTFLSLQQRTFGLLLGIAVLFTTAFLSTQPLMAQSSFRFGDQVPSFHGGYYVNGIPSSLFIDTGENRFHKAGRTFAQSIGGLQGVGDDLADIGLFPLREPLLFGAAVLSLGVLVSNDFEVTSYYQNRIEPLFDGFSIAPIIPRFGLSGLPNIGAEGQYLLAGIGLTYAAGFAFNDERAQVAALLSTKAVAYSYLVSHVLLKPVFGRLRPLPDLSSYAGQNNFVDSAGRSPNPYQWGNPKKLTLRSTSYATAMPSFHYTMYFAVARVYSGVYDNSILPYVAAGVLSVANIRGHNHWVSDMAAGAIIGTVIGQSILDNYVERRGGISTSFTPIVSSSGFGARVTVSF